MNKFSIYKRTKNDIIKKFANAVPKKTSATLYSKNSSEKKPFKEATLTSETKDNALKLSNYYRWLGGLTTFSSASNDDWKNAGKGAVLLAASEFSHSPEKPSGMSDDFYNSAKSGTSGSNIAMNFASNQDKIIYTIRQFLNDSSYEMPLHRTTFFTRNATNIAYGFSSYYVCQTVKYKDDPNPSGTAVVNNNEIAYAWPAPGDFPAEDISKQAYWTVNLNTDKLNLSNLSAEVTIENLDTGKKFKRTSDNNKLSTTSFWGRFLSFAPPEDIKDSYSGKRYKVTITNLSDKDSFPAKLEYTINFFSYKDVIYTKNGKKYSFDEYGEKQEIKDISSVKSKIKIEYKSKAYTGKNLKPKVTISGLKKNVDFTVKYSNNKNPGKAKITIKGKGIYAGSLTKTFKIKPAKTKLKLASTKNKKVNLKWKKVPKATGYEIYMATSKNGKYKKIKTIKNVKTIKFTKKNLKKKKTYYFKARAFSQVGKDKFYSSYSNKLKVKVK